MSAALHTDRRFAALMTVSLRAADDAMARWWGERDSIIPLSHGEAAHEAMPGSRLEVFPDAGHMPHAHDPRRFAQIITEFCQRPV